MMLGKYKIHNWFTYPCMEEFLTISTAKIWIEPETTSIWMMCEEKNEYPPYRFICQQVKALRVQVHMLQSSYVTKT